MQGGVRKRGLVWYYYFEIDSDNGKRKKIERKGGSTKPEAQATLRAEILKYENGYVEPKKQTIKAYLDDWLENYIKENRKINTYNRYKEILKNNICPSMGDVLLKNIKPIFIDKMLATEKKNGLSNTTLQNIYSVLNSAFNRAVKLRVMPDNPCRYVDRPKRDKFIPNVLTVEEFNNISNSLKLDSYNNYIFWIALQIVLELGLRRGELGGLEWSNIDYEKNTILIKNNLIYSNSKVFINTTKTQESERVLYISYELIKLLKSHKTIQSSNKLSYGENYIKNTFNNKEYNFVMTWENGKYVHPNYYTSKFKKVLNNINFDRNIRFHDLRHTNATLMLENGTDLKVIQERLGHADYATTANIYAHVNLEMQKKASGKLTKIIHGGKPVAK